MIYAVEICNKKFVKIGYSANDDLSVRIAGLQTGCPYEIRPILSTFGTLRQEKSLHSSLLVAFHRIRIEIPPNEWYPGRHPFMQEVVEYLRYGPLAALALIENKNPAVKQFGKKGKAIGDLRDIMCWPQLVDRS